MDNEILEIVYQENKKIVELGLAKLWKDEVKKSSEEEIISAYVPLTIFDSKILSYFRAGISAYFEDEMFEFDCFTNNLINKITENGEFVVSKIIFNSLDYPNDVALSLIKKQDPELSYKLERVMDNLILSSKLINFSYVVDRQEQKRLSKILKKDISENYNHVDMEVIVSFLSYDMLKSLNDDFKLVNNSLFSKTIKRLKNKNKLFSTPMVENKWGNVSLKEDNLNIDNFEINSNDFLNEELIEANTDLLRVEEDDIENYKKRTKANKFKLKYEKKENNLKIILISLFVIGVSFLTAYKFISSEIENKNNIYGMGVENESELPTLVNYIEAGKFENK